MMNLRTSLGCFRLIAIMEGISYILLLGIAMPMKYFMAMPMAVKVAGWAHGFLFVCYMLLLTIVFFERGWSVTKALLAFLVSLIPFATFWFDSRLRKEEEGSPV